jgi:hypothetical protein
LKRFQITDFSKIFDADVNPPQQIADYIGLIHYAWVSSDYINDDPSYYEGVIEI